MQAYLPGVDQYRCCPHNYGMGWPYFAEELWLATPDSGLAAAMYAASAVTAKVARRHGGDDHRGHRLPVRRHGHLHRHRRPQALAFPLYLRIPGWCAGAAAHGERARRCAAAAGPAFARVDRTWADGDRSTLRLPQRTAPCAPGRRTTTPCRSTTAR